MTLTQEEREAVERWRTGIYVDVASKVSDAFTLARVTDALLSARAVPMETVGWMDSDGEIVSTDEYEKFNGYGKSCYPKPLVLRSAAEAYAEGLRAMVEKLEAALTPSAETKAAYMGEFRFWIDEHDEEGQRIGQRIIAVPWTTIKEVMAAISARALTSTETPKDGL